jgi:hypothetical protein
MGFGKVAWYVLGFFIMVLLPVRPVVTHADEGSSGETPQDCHEASQHRSADFRLVLESGVDPDAESSNVPEDLPGVYGETRVELEIGNGGRRASSSASARSGGTAHGEGVATSIESRLDRMAGASPDHCQHSAGMSAARPTASVTLRFTLPLVPGSVQEASGEAEIILTTNTDMASGTTSVYHVSLWGQREFNETGGKDSETTAIVTLDGVETRTSPEFKRDPENPYTHSVLIGESLQPLDETAMFNAYARVRYEGFARAGSATAAIQPSQKRPKLPEHIGRQAAYVACVANILGDPSISDVEEGISAP